MSIPVAFLGHGNPMNALEENAWTRAWMRFGGEAGAPRGVLVISAHWYVEQLAVTAMEKPRTIHDFGGFPRSLYEVRYPAPGDPALAGRVADLLSPLPVERDGKWGLDHGAWSVLTHVFPAADVPVVQLSVDATQSPRFHFELGRRLAPLSEEGVLLLGSGNVVHNLAAFRWGEERPRPYDWALRFEALVRERIEAGDFAPLVDYAARPDAALAVPTPDHYLPLLPILGAAGERPATILCDGIDGGSVSMLAVRFG